MTSLIFLMVTQGDKVQIAADRFARAMKAMPTYEMFFVSTGSGRPDVQADMVVDEHRRLMYHVFTSRIDYKLTISPAGGYREVDRGGRVYEDHPYEGSTYVHRSRISPTLKALPGWIHVKTLQGLIPATSKFSYVRNETVSGHDCIALHADFKSNMGAGKVDVDVATDGLIYRVRTVQDGMQGPVKSTWEVSRYVPLNNPNPAIFVSIVPDGYSPYALADSGVPIEVGAKPNLAGWVDSKTGHAWTPAKGKPLLLVVTGSDSAPSDRAVKAFSSWKSELNQRGATVAIASDATTKSGSRGLLFNPSGASLRALSVPATPMVYLLDAKGAVTNLWMGFGPGQSSHIHDDLLQAIAGLK